MTSKPSTMRNAALLTTLSAALALGGCAGARKANSDTFALGTDRAPTPRTLLMMSKLLAEKGDNTQAEYVLIRINEDHPGYTAAWVQRGELLIRQDRTVEARDVLQSATQVCDPDPVLTNNLGLLMLSERDLPGAESCFRAAVDLDPAEARYHANLGACLAMQLRSDEALAEFRKAVPEPQAYWNLAVISEGVGDFDTALAAYTRADQLDPTLGAAKQVARLSPEPVQPLPSTQVFTADYTREPSACEYGPYPVDETYASVPLGDD